MSGETYGSVQLRVESIEDKVGKKVKKDTLFYNLIGHHTTIQTKDFSGGIIQNFGF